MDTPEAKSEVWLDGLCSNCPTACCRGDLNIVLELDEREAANLRRVGTELKDILPAGSDVDWADKKFFKQNSPDQRKFAKRAAKQMAPGRGLFGLVSDCGFLIIAPDGRGVCSVRDNPELRPAVCSEFPEGGSSCRDIRDKAITHMAEMDDDFMPDLGAVALGEAELRTIQLA